ncbi:hypothetical protein C2845_PM18G07580 [Panicum miliaceum]|uniref:Uncharacterized protein n=1 Tax=Panicum miliaceum TaxID=4540 RepID=A0A3L6PGX0_PANMI|nr:hypothetical protein C2845_PM18G07580 [Panicum miliaceum]
MPKRLYAYTGQRSHTLYDRRLEHDQVNLKLSSWLLSKLDTDESCIVIHEKRRIFVHEKDLDIVFGIPCGDLDVFNHEINPTSWLTRLNCGLSPKDPRSLKGIENVLEKHLDDKSTRLEVENFKILFLDNIDLRSLNKNHNILPRIKVFIPECFRRMATMCGEHDFSSFIRMMNALMMKEIFLPTLFYNEA